MRGQGWWHVAILGIAAVLAALVLVNAQGEYIPVGALAAVVALVAGWFIVGRHAEQNPAARMVFVPLVILASGIGTAFEPSFATVQCVAYPLLWTIVETRARGILASVAIAMAVGIGLVISDGSLVQALAIQSISLALSVALGLWISGIAHQSSERQTLLDELRDTQHQLATLSRDAGAASEREHLARELHDTIAQDLTGLVMLAQRARREGGASDDTLALLEDSARTVLADTRSLVAASAPVGLGGGVAEALERLGDRFARETGLPVSVEVTLPAVDRDTEVVLLRCAQEGLANVRKHSGASRATVTAFARGDEIAMRVDDDGGGFDPATSSSGFGLAGMRERLALVGGELDVRSSPAGTTLTATLPLRGAS